MIHQLLQRTSLLKTQGKGLMLIVPIVLGTLLPQFHWLSFLIKYVIMAMLFLSFLDIKFRPEMFQKSVIWVLVANATVAFVSYAVLARTNSTLALAAFMTAIAPTALAAPVIIRFLRGKIEYVVTAVLITNVCNAVIIPLALPSLLGNDIQIPMREVLQPVLIVMFVPLLLALLVRRLPSAAQNFLDRGKPLSFYLWLLNLFVVTSNASDFIRRGNSDSLSTLIYIALISLVICIINFSLGALLGGRQHWQEASQALGQKNLSFVIWVALSFINPLVAMGPTFYILYHNMYNSWSIYRFEKQQSRV